MASAQTIENPNQAVDLLQNLDVDNQLAVLWSLYLEMKDQLNPGTGDASGFNVSEALYDQIKAMSDEEQLQVQRDIASGATTEIAKTYRAYSSSGKLFLWLRLAQGMEAGKIVNVPDDFGLSEDAETFFKNLKSMDLEAQTTFMRNAVQSMGS